MTPAMDAQEQGLQDRLEHLRLRTLLVGAAGILGLIAALLALTVYGGQAGKSILQALFGTGSGFHVPASMFRAPAEESWTRLPALLLLAFAAIGIGGIVQLTRQVLSTWETRLWMATLAGLAASICYQQADFGSALNATQRELVKAVRAQAWARAEQLSATSPNPVAHGYVMAQIGLAKADQALLQLHGKPLIDQIDDQLMRRQTDSQVLSAGAELKPQVLKDIDVAVYGAPHTEIGLQLAQAGANDQRPPGQAGALALDLLWAGVAAAGLGAAGALLLLWKRMKTRLHGLRGGAVVPTARRDHGRRESLRTGGVKLSLSKPFVLVLLALVAFVAFKFWGPSGNVLPAAVSPASESAASRYAALAFPDGFVLDRETRLVWHRCPIGTELDKDQDGPFCKGQADWVNVEFSRAIAQSFAKHGQTWRLPTLKELESIATPRDCCQALDAIAFPMMQEPPERPIVTSHLDRYSFHSSNVDEPRRLSWRVDWVSGKSLEEPLRTSAFVRLVRNATPEELQDRKSTVNLDRSDLAKAEKRQRPLSVARSPEYLAAREQSMAGGDIQGNECHTLSPQVTDTLRGCLSGARSNLVVRLRKGAEYAAANKPRKSYECKLDDPVMTIGCMDHFNQHLGDLWPNYPLDITTAECERSVETEFRANMEYSLAKGDMVDIRAIRSMEGRIQRCRAFDEAHAKGVKLVDRPWYVGGPSPY